MPDRRQPLHGAPDVAPPVEGGDQPCQLGYALAPTGMHQQGGRHMRGLGRRNLPDRPGQPVCPWVAHGAQRNEHAAEQVIACGCESAAAANQGGNSARHHTAGQPCGQRRHRGSHHGLERLEIAERELGPLSRVRADLQHRAQRAPPPPDAKPGVAELDSAIADQDPAQVGGQGAGQHQGGRQPNGLWRANTDQRHPLVVSDDVYGGSDGPDDPGQPGRSLQQRREDGGGSGEPADARCMRSRERADCHTSPLE